MKRTLALVALLLAFVGSCGRDGVEGEGERNRTDASALVELESLRKAAEQGDADAQFSLGVKYATGEGVAEDFARAANWYTKAAEQGHTSAQSAIGAMYFTGQGVTEDAAEAAKWFREAAEQGNAGAQFLLGGMYVDGRGVPEDVAEAAKWYRKAAEQGDAASQFQLGRMYVDGRGVPEDNVHVHNVHAYLWLSLAAARGSDMAREVRDMVAERMTREQIAEAQRLARKWSETHQHQE